MEKSSEKIFSRLSYAVVKEMAPEELDLFDDVKDEFLKNPKAFQEKDPKKREMMLGFGEGAGDLVTSYVLPMVADSVKKFVDGKLERVLKKEDQKEQQQSQQVDLARIRQMRQEAINTGLSMGMAQRDAEMMADTMVGKMLQLG